MAIARQHYKTVSPQEARETAAYRPRIGDFTTSEYRQLLRHARELEEAALVIKTHILLKHRRESFETKLQALHLPLSHIHSIYQSGASAYGDKA